MFGKDCEEKLYTSTLSGECSENEEPAGSGMPEMQASASNVKACGAAVLCAEETVGAAGNNNKPGELVVSDICKSFGDVKVMRHISFTVRNGEFVTLLGPSGCGKTTLLRILGGLELADHGEVTLMGHSILRQAAYRRPVNTVFQNYALFPHLSVFENIAFGLRSRKIANPEVNRRVGEVMEMLQLGEFSKRHPHQLSGGQKQRVAMARALVNEPELLLLDEPMSALDAKLRAEVQLDLRRLQRELGKTFILVTHDQDEAMTVSDRIMVMNNGRIAQAGTPTEVYEHPVDKFVAQFLGSANLIAAERVDGSARTAIGSLRLRKVPTWQTGTLAIRPERIRVARQTPNHNGVRCVVKEMIYRGDHYDVFVDTGALRVLVAPAEQLHVGQRIWLELPP